MTRAKMPGLVEDIRYLCNELDLRAKQYSASGKLGKLLSKLEEEAPKTLEAFCVLRNRARDVYVAVSTEHATATILKDREAMFSSLQSLLPTLAAVQEFAENKGLTAEIGCTAFPAEAYAIQLNRLDSAAAALTPTHLNLQLHAASFGSEYWVQGDDRFEVAAHYKRLNQAFYAPLLDARDEFFFDGSQDNLERYVTIAERLMATEHPLEPLAEHKPYVSQSPDRRAKAEKLLDSLAVESLMAPVLTEGAMSILFTSNDDR